MPVRRIAEEAKQGKLEPSGINEEVISAISLDAEHSRPGLLIRTSGEMRISNFLLWQISYAELVITPTLWPDFRKPQFFEALEDTRAAPAVWRSVESLQLLYVR